MSKIRGEDQWLPDVLRATGIPSSRLLSSLHWEYPPRRSARCVPKRAKREAWIVFGLRPGFLIDFVRCPSAPPSCLFHFLPSSFRSSFRVLFFRCSYSSCPIAALAHLSSLPFLISFSRSVLLYSTLPLLYLPRSLSLPRSPSPRRSLAVSISALPDYRRSAVA